MAKRNGVRIFRTRKGLTQKQLADAVGVSFATVSLIENSERNGENSSFWVRLQTVYNLTDKQIEKLKNGQEI